MLLKNWSQVLTLLTGLWNNTATYIIWIIWDNYWLSLKSVAMDTVHVSFISKLFFRLNVSLLLCPGFRILCSVSLVMTASDLLFWWVRLAYLKRHALFACLKKVLLMKKACNVSNKCVNLPKILAVFTYGFIQTYIYLDAIYNSN